MAVLPFTMGMLMDELSDSRLGQLGWKCKTLRAMRDAEETLVRLAGVLHVEDTRLHRHEINVDAHCQAYSFLEPAFEGADCRVEEG